MFGWLVLLRWLCDLLVWQIAKHNFLLLDILWGVMLLDCPCHWMLACIICLWGLWRSCQMLQWLFCLSIFPLELQRLHWWFNHMPQNSIDSIWGWWWGGLRWYQGTVCHFVCLLMLDRKNTVHALMLFFFFWDNVRLLCIFIFFLFNFSLTSSLLLFLLLCYTIPSVVYAFSPWLWLSILLIFCGWGRLA